MCPVSTRGPILAIASAGGHWEQLMMMRPAWSGEHVHYATTLAGLERDLYASADQRRVHLVPDCNRHSRVDVAHCAAVLLLLLLRLRPRLVLTTGALPGLLALVIAKSLGRRTIWIDSVANATEISLAGRQARRHADLWLTQWPAVAATSGANYFGSVL